MITKKENKIDLVFHIGYSKSASSTLQRSIFPDTEGYLGKGRYTSVRHNFSNYFVALSPCNRRLSGNFNDAKKWTKEVIKLKNQDFPNCERLILSSEALINNGMFKVRPIIPFLKKFNEDVWIYGDVKIILVIRNQADRIASAYAEASKKNRFSSQSDFEKFLKKTIKKRYENYNYSACVEELYQHFGKEKVCVLLMEDINDIKFWRNLKKFADLPDFNPNDMISAPRNNKKSAGENKWKLQQYSKNERARSNVYNFFGLFWPSYIAPALRDKAKAMTESLLKRVYRSEKPNSLIKEEEIVLSDEAKKAIRNAFSKSNKKLEITLNRNLKELGYY